MSHEIRNPLSVTLMNTELLRGTPLSPEQTELCDNMGAASELLLAIVNDILDLTKLQSGTVRLERIEFSPVELFEAIVAGSATRIKDKVFFLLA
jgi:signal transduction histidine kinase